MPETLNLFQAKVQLSRLIDRAAAGEEIITAKNGKPLARLVPLEASAPRKPGLLKGKIRVADDFDDPLPPEILSGFMGEDEEDRG